MAHPDPCLLCGVEPSRADARRPGARCPTCDVLLPGAGPVDGHLQDVTALARRGEQVNAIRLYRGLTRAGLAEAKEAVERLERGETLSPPALDRLTAPPRPPADGEVEQLLIAGRKIEAIKRQRELTGWGLKESKDAVEALAVKLRLNEGAETTLAPPRSRGWVLGVIMVGVLLLMIAALFVHLR